MPEDTGQREPSEFECLPGEILNSIYRYTVVEDKLVEAATCVWRKTDERTTKETRVWQTNEPAIARTCKKFRDDVLPIYYAENIFSFPLHEEICGRNITALCCPPQFLRWLEVIGPVNKHIVQIGAVGEFRTPEGSEIVYKHIDIVASIPPQEKRVHYTIGPEAEGHFDLCCLTMNSCGGKMLNSHSELLYSAMREIYDHFDHLWCSNPDLNDYSCWKCDY